jgi:hypothetical protein
LIISSNLRQKFWRFEIILSVWIKECVRYQTTVGRKRRILKLEAGWWWKTILCTMLVFFKGGSMKIVYIVTSVSLFTPKKLYLRRNTLLCV